MNKTPTPEQLQAVKNALENGHIDNFDPNHDHIDVLEFCVRFTAKALGEPSYDTLLEFYKVYAEHSCSEDPENTLEVARMSLDENPELDYKAFKKAMQQIAKECAE